MPIKPDLTKLKTSWTKYDAVQVIDIVTNKEIGDYLSKRKKIDEPILKSFLGIKNLSDPIPDYWVEIQKYPRQLRLFSLFAALFTSYKNIKSFAEKYSKGKMKGIFIAEDGKLDTNIRSALVESGASPTGYRREKVVPYNVAPLFENGQVGLLFKKLLQERLLRVGFQEDVLNTSAFYNICNGYEIYKALSLSKELFHDWLEGSGIDDNIINSTYSFSQLKIYKEIKTLKVNQWLSDWDDIDFKSAMRRKPDPFFLIFKIDARLLKRLSDVHRRNNDAQNIQRKHDENRSNELRKYIEGGFPWSTMKKADQSSPENEKLKMPGILPTAIIANIIGPSEKRGSTTISQSDIIKVKDIESDFPSIIIPNNIFNDTWDPQVKPIEIIDGQHRLWAFDENDPISGNYELPVVAYYNLDRTWQAYMFYTINIKPVKINTSLGYDLYPLLRTQEWLEKSKDGLLTYRENRAQEIVEVLWRYPGSPWKERINMIGENSGATISQASFIRTFTSTFFKSTRSSHFAGGLFSESLANKNGQVVDWNRAQQASFIILIWQQIARSVSSCNGNWAISLRSEVSEMGVDNPAFASRNSLLSRDQGVRGISMLANDFFYEVANSNDWDFNSLFVWDRELDDELLTDTNISVALHQFNSNPRFIELIKSFADELCKFDWRTTSASFDAESERVNQMRFKGSSGYGEIYRALLTLFLNSENVEVVRFSKLLI